MGGRKAGDGAEFIGAQRLQGLTQLSESGLLCLAEVLIGADIDDRQRSDPIGEILKRCANSSSLMPNRRKSSSWSVIALVSFCSLLTGENRISCVVDDSSGVRGPNRCGPPLPLIHDPPGEGPVVEPGRFLGREAQRRPATRDDELPETGPVDRRLGRRRRGQSEGALEAVEGDAVRRRLGDDLIALADAADDPAVAHHEDRHLGPDAGTRPVERPRPPAGGHTQDGPVRRRLGTEEHVGRGEAVERKDADVGAVDAGHDMD